MRTEFERAMDAVYAQARGAARDMAQAWVDGPNGDGMAMIAQARNCGLSAAETILFVEAVRTIRAERMARL